MLPWGIAASERGVFSDMMDFSDLTLQVLEYLSTLVCFLNFPLESSVLPVRPTPVVSISRRGAVECLTSFHLCGYLFFFRLLLKDRLLQPGPKKKNTQSSENTNELHFTYFISYYRIYM